MPIFRVDTGFFVLNVLNVKTIYICYSFCYAREGWLLRCCRNHDRKNDHLAAEQRIGELLLAIPSASGRRTDLETSSERVEKVKTKSETVKEMGYSKDEASDYQQMAKHPEVRRMIIVSGRIQTNSCGIGSPQSPLLPLPPVLLATPLGSCQGLLWLYPCRSGSAPTPI